MHISHRRVNDLAQGSDALGRSVPWSAGLGIYLTGCFGYFELRVLTGDRKDTWFHWKDVVVLPIARYYGETALTLLDATFVTASTGRQL
jgi:hypothetical protein